MRNRPHPSRKKQPLPSPFLREALSVSEVRRQADGWILDGKVRQLSADTLYGRRLATDKLLWFLDKNGIDLCDTTALKRFLGYIGSSHETEEGRWDNKQNQEKARPSTVLTYYSRLKTFFAYLVQEEILDRSPMERIQRPEAREDHVQPFSLSQVNALLHAATQSYEAKRNKAIVLFLLDTGVRASELCGLKMNGVDLAAKSVSVLGKGNKRRTVYFGNRTAKALLAYLSECQHEPEEPILFSWDKTDSRDPLTRWGLLQLIERLGKAARVDGVRCSPHTFRHTFAVEFIRNGGNVFGLQLLLGHTSLTMCRRYLALAQADIENQHRRNSPVDRM